MDKIYIHPHALKHGLSAHEIKQAWKNFVAKSRRQMPKDDQIVCVGFSPQHKRAVQMIGVTNSKGTMIYHAMTPPQKSILKELGLERKKR